MFLTDQRAKYTDQKIISKELILWDIYCLLHHRMSTDIRWQLRDAQARLLDQAVCTKQLTAAKMQAIAERFALSSGTP